MERKKELEDRIEELSKQLQDTEELILRLHKNLIEVSGFVAQGIEERRKDAEKKEKKSEILIYYRSLVMGLILGIFGNLFVSYLMKAFEILNLPSESWIFTAIATLALVSALIWLFYREIKKVSKEISSTV